MVTELLSKDKKLKKRQKAASFSHHRVKKSLRSQRSLQ